MPEIVDLSKRAVRQGLRLPSAKLERCRLVIIGTGAIGRQAALQAASIGFHKIVLYDHDTVEVVNLASQGFWESDLGKPKVQAVREHMTQCNSGIQVEAYQEKFARMSAPECALGEDPNVNDVVLCCVDSIETRGKIYAWVKDLKITFVDGRMSAETFRILSWTNDGKMPMYRDYYQTTLFTAAEAYSDGGCTQQSTIHNASAAAAFMIQQVSKFLRDMPLDKDFQVDLFSNRLFYLGKG